MPAWFDLLKAGLLACIMVFQLAKKKVPRRVLRLKSFYLNLEIYACSLALHPLNDVARCARWSIHWQQDSSTKSSIQISETMGICSKHWKAIHAFRLNDQDQIKYVSRIIQVVSLLRCLCWQTNIEFVLLTSNEIDYNNVKSWSNRTLVHKQLWSEFQGSNRL